MEETISSLTFYGVALLYPLITGPLAAWLLYWAAKSEQPWYMTLYWPSLVVLHGAGFFLLRGTLGDVGVGPGFVSCWITPVIGVSSALVLRIASRWFEETTKLGMIRRRRLTVGVFMIPVLQIITLFLMALYAPSR
jgi:hypothetical protein